MGSRRSRDKKWRFGRRFSKAMLTFRRTTGSIYRVLLKIWWCTCWTPTPRLAMTPTVYATTPGCHPTSSDNTHSYLSTFVDTMLTDGCRYPSYNLENAADGKAGAQPNPRKGPVPLISFKVTPCCCSIIPNSLLAPSCSPQTLTLRHRSPTEHSAGRAARCPSTG